MSAGAYRADLAHRELRGRDRSVRGEVGDDAQAIAASAGMASSPSGTRPSSPQSQRETGMVNWAPSALSATGCIPVRCDSGGAGVSLASIGPQELDPRPGGEDRVGMATAHGRAPGRLVITTGARRGGGLGVLHGHQTTVRFGARGGRFRAALPEQALNFPRTPSRAFVRNRHSPGCWRVPRVGSLAWRARPPAPHLHKGRRAGGILSPATPSLCRLTTSRQALPSRT